MRVAAPLLLAVLTAGPALAEPKVDVVVLNNGTRVVGEIRSMQKARLELGTDDMGTIQIEWGNVTQVTAPEFFEVEKMGGGLLFGSLRPGPGEGTLEVVADWGDRDPAAPRGRPDPTREVELLEPVQGLDRRGGSYTSASELLQLELDGDLRFRRPRFEATATANAVLTQQPDVDDTRRARSSSATRGCSPTGTGSSPGHRRAEPRARVRPARQPAGRLGTRLVRNARNELVGGAGLSVNREKPVEGESTTNLEAAAGFDYANFAYDFPNTDIQVAAMGYLGLNQWGRFRLESSASLRREVFSDFYFGLKGYESYDSEPATEGAQKNDWGLSLTLGYSF